MPLNWIFTKFVLLYLPYIQISLLLACMDVDNISECFLYSMASKYNIYATIDFNLRFCTGDKFFMYRITLCQIKFSSVQSNSMFCIMFKLKESLLDSFGLLFKQHPSYQTFYFSCILLSFSFYMPGFTFILFYSLCYLLYDWFYYFSLL